MIYLVVHLTYVPGHEAECAEYERTVLAFFREHGGEVLGAFRPAPWADGTRAAYLQGIFVNGRRLPRVDTAAL